jgi:CheY-like chemotaxis protein
MTSENIIVSPAFEQCTVLLVEDNEDDVVIMQNCFAKAGVPNPVRSVSDGEQAIAYLKGEPPFDDRQQYPFPIVVFLDLNMPKKNGLEVLAWMRGQPTLNGLTVHVLTASVRSTDVERAFELGANSYLIKPSRFDVLVEMMKAWHTMARRSAFSFRSMRIIEGAPQKNPACQSQP